MSKLERLWTDRDLQGITDTVVYLRKMRTAAFEKEPEGIRALFVHRIPQEVVLFDARELASNAGNFFATTISHATDGRHEREAWLDRISLARRKYKGKETSTHAKTVPTDVGQNTISKLRDLSIDPAYVVNWWITLANNLGANSTDDLIQRGVGVVSPLSGDYLMATTLRSYLDMTRGGAYPLKLAIANRDVSSVIFERGEQGMPFGELREIGIFQDVAQTGETGRALHAALAKAYPSHTVFEPRGRVEFEPSRKIMNAIRASRQS